MYTTHSLTNAYPIRIIRIILEQADNTMSVWEIAQSHDMPEEDVQYILEHAPSWM